jgi:hypothetical protein
VAFLFVAAITALSSVPHCSAAGVLLLPGMILAAFIFPQGIHSNWGETYLVVAFVIDWVLFAVFFILLVKLLNAGAFAAKRLMARRKFEVCSQAPLSSVCLREREKEQHTCELEY